MELQELVNDFASGLKAADALSPQASSYRGDRLYRPGIGPHAEDTAVALTLTAMRTLQPDRYERVRPVSYPSGSRLRCDLGFGEPLEWVVEVKMARAFGDNGKLDDTYLKDLLSPYERDHSALTDARKLLAFACRRAILVYGFDYPEMSRPLGPALDALELLLRACVNIGPRASCGFDGLLHPVHSAGRVTAWEVVGDLPGK
jgi:hypothetical protein